VVLESSALVDQPVSLFRGQVAAPVRNLDIALQDCRMRDGLGKLVAHAHRLLCASWHVVVEPIGERRALLLRVCLLLVVELGWEGCVVWDVTVGELDLGSLLLGKVCGWRVRAEGVLQVLLLRLGDLRGDRLEGGENRVGDANGLLCLGRKRFGKVDLVVLGRAVGVSARRSLPIGHVELPFRVEAYHLDFEDAQVGILLVSYFESSNLGNQARLEWQVVFGLRLRINVLDDDVDGLARVCLVEVDCPDEVVVLEHLGRRKGAREQLLG
jgi:hypothetical protein